MKTLNASNAVYLINQLLLVNRFGTVTVTNGNIVLNPILAVKCSKISLPKAAI